VRNSPAHRTRKCERGDAGHKKAQTRMFQRLRRPLHYAGNTIKLQSTFIKSYFNLGSGVGGMSKSTACAGT